MATMGSAPNPACDAHDVRSLYRVANQACRRCQPAKWPRKGLQGSQSEQCLWMASTARGPNAPGTSSVRCAMATGSSENSHAGHARGGPARPNANALACLTSRRCRCVHSTAAPVHPVRGDPWCWGGAGAGAGGREHGKSPSGAGVSFDRLEMRLTWQPCGSRGVGMQAFGELPGALAVFGPWTASLERWWLGSSWFCIIIRQYVVPPNGCRSAGHHHSHIAAWGSSPECARGSCSRLPVHVPPLCVRCHAPRLAPKASPAVKPSTIQPWQLQHV